MRIRLNSPMGLCQIQPKSWHFSFTFSCVIAPRPRIFLLLCCCYCYCGLRRVSLFAAELLQHIFCWNGSRCLSVAVKNVRFFVCVWVFFCKHILHCSLMTVSITGQPSWILEKKKKEREKKKKPSLFPQKHPLHPFSAPKSTNSSINQRRCLIVHYPRLPLQPLMTNQMAANKPSGTS